MLAQDDQGEVAIPMGHSRDVVGRPALLQVERHRGTLSHERGEHVGERREGREHRQPDGDTSSLAVSRFDRQRRGAVQTGQRSLGVFSKHHTRLGQRDRTAGAGEQLHTELGFQGLEGLAYRGLDHVQPSGGATEVQLFGQREKRSNASQFHCHQSW